MLTDMMERQEEVMGLLQAVHEETDKTILVGLAGSLGHSDRAITAMVLALLEVSDDTSREIVVNDLIYAGSILDHLDTQGFELSVIAKLKRPPRTRGFVPMTDGIDYDSSEQ